MGVRIEPAHDPILDEPHEKTGRSVETTLDREPLFLVRGRHLSPGRVVGATPDAADLRLDNKSTTLRLGATTYRFRFRCATRRDDSGTIPCALVLDDGATSQRVHTYDALQLEGSWVFAGAVEPSVLWAGDLDRDGRLDLLLDASSHYNVYEPVLYLSSAAGEGELVRRVAAFRSIGC